MAAISNDRTGRCRLNRRAFLRTVGVTAVGVAVAATGGSPRPGVALADERPERRDGPSPGQFGRMFAQLPPFATASPALAAALLDIGKPGGILDARDDLSKGPIVLITDLTLSQNNPNSSTHTAGTTFLGQFVDHDLTFDTSSPLGVLTLPQDAPNARIPAFDLDSVYGHGRAIDPQLYDPSDRGKLKVESGGKFEDLPRAADRSAIIGDPRNDEHMMIAGLHAAFLKFHNRAVDVVRSQRGSGDDEDDHDEAFSRGGAERANGFRRARRLTTWHYQWVVVHVRHEAPYHRERVRGPLLWAVAAA